MRQTPAVFRICPKVREITKWTLLCSSPGALIDIEVFEFSISPIRKSRAEHQGHVGSVPQMECARSKVAVFNVV